MLKIQPHAVPLALLLCCLAPHDARADSSAGRFVTFLPDDTIPRQVLEAFLASRHVADYSVVRVDTDSLRAMIREFAHNEEPSEVRTIELPLVDESIVLIELADAEEYYEGWRSGLANFRGRVIGDEYSSVLCTIASDGSVHLTISTAGERHAMRKTSILPYHVYWTAGEFDKKID